MVGLCSQRDDGLWGGGLGFPIIGTWRGLWLSSSWTAQVGPPKAQVGLGNLEPVSGACRRTEALLSPWASSDSAELELTLTEWTAQERV